ncbi:MAG: hypothetical protein IJL22_06040 [Bacteroidales bacterium]|jgi:hypothetical protein|nr:hypothetical protein [Bacteroidales bacterium]
MKRLFLLLTVALVALVSCKKEDSDSSLEGRWNVQKTETDYSFSLIFKGNKLDVYIIAWGVHVSGTYTYANNEVTYNITSAQKAWTDVSFDEKGKMITYSWMAGDMDKDTFELVPGYDWYPLPEDDPSHPGDMLSKFKFELTSSTTAETDLMGGTAYKAK